MTMRHADDTIPAMPFYSTAQFAQKLGLSRQTVRIMITKGKLAGQKVGRNYVIDESELSRFKIDKKKKSHRVITTAATE